ncbi:MAG: hypothetical protein EBT61_18425 [Verrucomicrobia bacterium]|nr:hypothetical protein [Verrucomicrobiota bacterium]
MRRRQCGASHRAGERDQWCAPRRLRLRPPEKLPPHQGLHRRERPPARSRVCGRCDHGAHAHQGHCADPRYIQGQVRWRHRRGLHRGLRRAQRLRRHARWRDRRLALVGAGQRVARLHFLQAEQPGHFFAQPRHRRAAHRRPLRRLEFISRRGSGRTTHSREGVSSPCWSPDGQSICYVSSEDGPARLYRISAMGGAAQRIATTGVYNATEPDWSPDGKWIAFTTQRGEFEICVVPASGGEVQSLVPGQDPTWAPNSRTIMFSKRGRGGPLSLSLLDVPTKRVKDVPLNLGNCSQPAWAR